MTSLEDSIIALTNEKMRKTAPVPPIFGLLPTNQASNNQSSTIVEVHQQIYQQRHMQRKSQEGILQMGTKKKKLLECNDNTNSKVASDGDFCEQNDDTFAEEIDRNDEEGAYLSDQQQNQPTSQGRGNSQSDQAIVIEDDKMQNLSQDKINPQNSGNQMPESEKGHDGSGQRRDNRGRSPGRYQRDGNYQGRKQYWHDRHNNFENDNGSGRGRNFDNRQHSYGGNQHNNHNQNFGYQKRSSFHNQPYENRNNQGQKPFYQKYGGGGNNYRQQDQGQQGYRQQNSYQRTNEEIPRETGNYNAEQRPPYPQGQKPPLISAPRENLQENQRQEFHHRSSSAENPRSGQNRFDDHGEKRYQDREKRIQDDDRKFYDKPVNNRSTNFDRNTSGQERSDRSRSEHQSDKGLNRDRSPENTGRDSNQRQTFNREGGRYPGRDNQFRDNRYQKDDYNGMQRYPQRGQYGQNNQSFGFNRQQNLPNAPNHGNFKHQQDNPHNYRGRDQQDHYERRFSPRDKDDQYNQGNNARRQRSRSNPTLHQRQRSRSRDRGNYKPYGNHQNDYEGGRFSQNQNQGYQQHRNYGQGRFNNNHEDYHGQQNFQGGRNFNRGNNFNQRQNQNNFHNNRNQNKNEEHSLPQREREKHELTKKQVVAASSPSRPALEIEIRSGKQNQDQNVHASQPESGEAPSGNEIAEQRHVQRETSYNSNNRPASYDRKSDSIPDSFQSPQSNLTENDLRQNNPNPAPQNAQKQSPRDRTQPQDREIMESREQKVQDIDQNVPKRSGTNGEDQHSKNQKNNPGDGFPECHNDQGSIHVDDTLEQKRQNVSQAEEIPERKVSNELKEVEKPNPELIGKEADYVSSGWGENEGEQKPNEEEFQNNQEQINEDVSHANCNLYVAGIPKHATEDMLRKAFSRFGSIKSVNIIKNHQTREPKGFAYIMFSQAKEAEAAIEKMDQSNAFNEWKIKVEHAKHPGHRPMTGQQHHENRQGYFNNGPRLQKSHSERYGYNNFQQERRPFHHNNDNYHHRGGYQDRPQNMQRQYSNDNRGGNRDFHNNYHQRDFNNNHHQRDFHHKQQHFNRQDYPRGNYQNRDQHQGNMRGGYGRGYENRNSYNNYQGSFEGNQNQQLNSNYANQRYGNRDYGNTNKFYRSRSRSNE